MDEDAKERLSALEGVHLPDKVYFRIGEVSRFVGVDPHVLRYWETEFPWIRPVRGKAKQRLYRRRDVERLLLIRRLLHELGYTIVGARKRLRDMEGRDWADFIDIGAYPQSAESLVQELKAELRDILDQLDRRETEGRQQKVDN
ncbi:MAG: MerR family transcriptional regulator [Desulfobulbus sp.]